LRGWVGFSLWALVGAGVVVAFISFVGWLFLVPVAVVVLLVQRRSEWKDGSVLLGLITGAGLPLLLVAALNWNAWQDRTVGDATPNPYDWGAVGVFLAGAGIAAYALHRRRRR
jgi:MYXO-CTERM domain-containing protein